MQVTREDLNPCTVKLSIECDPAEVKDGFDKALRQIGKSLRIPGFRPGHAPKALIEKSVNPQQLFDTAADMIVSASLKKAIDEVGLSPDPNTRQSVTVKEFEKDEPKCTFDAKIPLPPQVEIGEYKGLELKADSVEVSDDEVEKQLDEIRQRRSTRLPITDRGVEEGDIAVVSIMPEGAKDSKNFMTIVGQTFPQLDAAITGMKVEEMKQATLAFPETFQEKDWAGKEMAVQISLTSATAVKLPEIDEEFAKALNTDSVDDLKTKLKEQMHYAKESMNRDLMLEQAMDLLVEKSKVEVSDNSWEDIANRRLNETAQEQGQQGKTMEEYAKENGMTIEELVAAWREKAKLYIKRAFLIREVFEKEQMNLTMQELNVELLLMAREFEMPPEQLLQELQKNNSIEEVRFRAISRKVGDFLLNNAKTAAIEEKPAKKARKKEAKEPVTQGQNQE